MPINPDPEAYRFLYEQARFNLARQEAALDELRTRTGILVAAATVVTSFLGQEAARDGWGLTGNLGLGAFVIVIGLWVYVLWPTYGWIFSNDVTVLREDYIESEPPRSMQDTYAILADKHACHIAGNESRLRWLYRAFRGGIILIAVEVVALLYDLPA